MRTSVRRPALPNRLKSLALSLERPVVNMRGCIRRQGFDFSTTHERMDSRIRWALAKNTYERPEIDMLRRHMRPDDRVLEVGICVGVTSLVTSKIVGAEDMLLYEADPRNFDLARTNFELNRVPLKMRNRVLWSGPNRPRSVRFNCNENPSSSSLLDRNNVAHSVEVETEAMEDVLAEAAPTVICSDIEGGEIDLFGKCADFGSVRLILLETHARLTGQDAVDGMLAHLGTCGFKVVESHNGDFTALARTP